MKLYEEYEYELPLYKSSRRYQVKQEPVASDDSRLSEDSNADVAIGTGMMLLLEACEQLAEEDCTAETKPDPVAHGFGLRRSTIARRKSPAATDVSGHGPAKAEVKVQKAGNTKRRSRTELHGPCCHCGATESPQWRKGPMCKPVLCNACGTRFLRTRSLGKIVMGRNGRRYTKESTPEEDCGCENSSGSTEDSQPCQPAAHTRRDSRLGLSRPSKTRRVDAATSALSAAPVLTTPAKPEPTPSAHPTFPTLTARPATSTNSTSTADSSLDQVNTTLTRLAASLPAEAAADLLHKLLGPSAPQHNPSSFILPPVPVLDMRLPSPPATSPYATSQASKPRLVQHPRSDAQPVFLHVQAGPLP